MNCATCGEDKALTEFADYLERERSCHWHMPVACAPGICGTQERDV